MEESKSKIFSNYYVKRDKKIIGPMRYEQLKEIMYNKKFIGNEKVSEDKESWVNIRKILPMLDSFLSAEQEELYNDNFIKQLHKQSQYKVKTTFNIVMGPFDNAKLLNLMAQGKIENDYSVMSDSMSVVFRKVKKRLYNRVEELMNAGEEVAPKVAKKASTTSASKVKPEVKAEKKPVRKPQVKKIEKKDLDELDEMQSINVADIGAIPTNNNHIEIKEVKKLSEDNIKGLLSTKPLLSLLFTYSLDKLTGILEITKKNDIFELSFKKGKLAYISTNKKRLSLSRFLQAEKGINVQYDDSLTDTELIPKLIADRKIDPSKIYDLLKELVIFRLKEVFKLTNGKFLFKSGATTEDTSLNIDFISHIWKFTFKLIPNKTIDKYVKEIEDYIIIKDERRFSYNNFLKLGPIELKLLNKINNKITSRQFINALTKQKAELVPTFKKLVYILYNLKFVKTGEKISSRNIKEEIVTLKAKIEEIEKENNHFVTLGIPEDTPLSKIRKLYIKAAKDYHPDKLNKEENLELRELKTNYYTYISTAYNKISTQKKLDEYREELKGGGTENFDAESLFKSEELFNKCKKAIKVGKYERALEFINEAINLFADNQEFYIHKLYLEFVFTWQSNLGVAKKHLAELEKKMETMEQYPEGFRFLGRMYKTLKNQNKARHYFKRLLDLVSYDTEAKREAR